MTVNFNPHFPDEKHLAGYSPWGRKELDMTEHTYTQKNLRKVI